MLALAIAALAVAVVLIWLVANQIAAWRIPSISVPADDDVTDDTIKRPIYKPGTTRVPKNAIPCYDPATMQYLGTVPAMSAQEVTEVVQRAKVAAQEWKSSTFGQRRRLLRILLKYIIEHQEDICRVSARDSGKPMVDAAFGEIIVTCEKICWLCREGERYLKPERRSAGIMMPYKLARVEYHPVGVVGAIVPFNYPFHNVFNPLTAAIFAGNSIVIKVSEHASWSTRYYGAIISEALAAAGAPPDLVQIVTGYAEAGHALVTSGLGKLIFVGSTEVGRKVMQSAAGTLTPVVLELGGKDAFIVCDDANLDTVVPTALRGAFQSCGQNCAGAERFIVHDAVYDTFVARVAAATAALRQGPALGGAMVDCGALCMPGLADKVHGLVQDAVNKGAKVLVGGELPTTAGQFYPPTLLVDVDPSMDIWREEVFGPVFTVVRCSDDDHAVQLANDCPFGLSSSVFSRSKRRARAIGERLEAGMTSVNDFTSTYMAQSLPFGGVKDSGFDRFAGVEGLRGLCVPKAVAEDALFFSTALPPMLRYPVSPAAFGFVTSLVRMFYSPSVSGQLGGLLGVLGALVGGGKGGETNRKEA